MLEFHNGKERDIDDWTWMIREADARFEITRVGQPSGSRLSIIEVRWRENRTMGESI